MNLLSGSSNSPARRTGVVTVLDVGSSKVSCIIAKLMPRDEGAMLRGRTHDIRVIGIGHHRSEGVKSGVITDLDGAEKAIRHAVDAAERMAGIMVDSLIVNVSAGRIKSETYSATVNLGGEEADAHDIKRVLEAGARQAQAAERQVIHSLPTGYVLDGERGIRDPLGMIGDTLGVDMHVLTGDAAPLRNLELAVNRCHLSVERMVATPYASGLAALVDDETEMGAACIDIGGGTMTMAVFVNGRFVHGDSIPVGGRHITMDLARGLSTRVEAAERLKAMYGSALPSAADDRDIVSIPAIDGEDSDATDAQQVPRAVVTRIIRARTEEMLEQVRDRLNASGYGAVVGRRVVLTGGAAQLNGLPEVARRILGRNVRVGRPLGVAGLPAAAKGPAFSTTVGLMIYPQVAGLETSAMKHSIWNRKLTGTGGRLSRVGQWLRDNL